MNWTYLLAFLLVTSIHAEPLTLQTAYLASDSSQTANLQGSLFGGTSVIIRAQGLIMDPTLYQVYIGDYPCQIPAQGIQSSFISCETTSTGRTSDLKDQLILVVYSGSLYEVPSKNFDYLAGNTPLLYYTYPISSPPDTLLRFFGQHRASDVGDGQKNFGDIIGFYVGEDQCNLQGIEQVYAGNTNSFDQIMCYQSKNLEGGYYDVTSHMKVGKSRTHQSIETSRFDGDEYFEHIVVPSIQSVSPTTGLIAGHEITITGNGFSNFAERNVVTVDGLNCEVTDATTTSITCNRAAKTDLSSTTQLETDPLVLDPQVNGWIKGAGFRYEKYQLGPSSYADWKAASDAGTLSGYTLLESGIRHELWMPKNVESGAFAYIYKGYFLAPVDGEYRFSGYGDDNFGLYISDTYGTASTPSTPYISVGSYMSNTDDLFYDNRTSVFGEAKTLEAGKYYYMELYHVNTQGVGYIKIRAEVPNTDGSLKWKRDQVSHIETTFTNQAEIKSFEVNGVTDPTGTFEIKLSQMDYSTLETVTQSTGAISFNSDAQTFANKLKNIDIFNKGVSGVSAQAFDAAGNSVALSSVDATKFKWTVSFWQVRDRGEDNKITTTSSAGSLTLTQTQITPHGDLISGAFTITVDGLPLKIWDITISQYSNINIPYNVGQGTLKDAFNNLLGVNSVTVRRKDTPEWGSTWVIYFNSINPDNILHPNGTSINLSNIVVNAGSLAGGKIGTFPQVGAYQDQAYSPNLVFNPIGHRFMFMQAPSLNVHVKTNGILAECSGDCSYEIITNTPQVLTNTLDPATATVTVTMSDPQGWNYPTSDLNVAVDGQICTITTGSFTSFTCTLPTNTGDGSPVLTAGEWFVNVKVRNLGEVPISDSAVAMSYGLALDSVSPNTGADNGGYTATLNGNGFPSNIADVQISICSKKTTINSISNTDIQIIIPNCGATGADTVSLTYDGTTLTVPFTYTANAMGSAITSISPASASPVRKQVMTITGSGFGIDKSLVKVRLANYDMPKFYPMKILTLSDTEITCGIPGGLAGQYQVQVTIVGSGDVLPTPETANDFTYELIIESISPTTGFYYGGTQLTITGRNFSPEDTENLVFVGNQLNWFCVIETFSQTQIICRMPPYHSDWEDNNVQGVIVSSKLTEDSVCEGTCTFTYGDQETSPLISSISPNSILSNSNSAVTITGQNFDLISSSDVRVVLENTITKEITVVVPQATPTATSVSFLVPAVPSASYNVRVRMDPLGQTNSLRMNIKSQLTPTSYSGSVQGGNIVLKGQGLPSEWPSNLFKLQLSVGGVKIDPQVASSSPQTLEISVPPGTLSYSIVLEDPTGTRSTASFSQSAGSTPMMTLDTTSATPGASTSVTLTQNSLTTESPSKVYIYNVLDPEDMVEILAADYTFSSPTLSFSYTFKTGKYGFKIWFDKYGWAQISSQLSASASADFTASLTSSSFMGGQIVVSGDHISDNAELRIGAFSGKVISSTSTEAVFQIPPLITPSVISGLSLKETTTELSYDSIISDEGQNPEKTFDSLTSTVYQSSNASCHIGIDLGSGRIAAIKRIRYFPSMEWVIVSNFLKGAVFQGSVDDVTYTEIGIVDETAHSGWNSILVTDTTGYRYIRLRHDSQSMCKIAEMEVFGVLMSDATVSDITSYTTSAIVTDGLNTYTLNNVVEYRQDKTPKITDLSALTGSIHGGDTITLTGVNLDFGTAVVLIDKIPCVVGTTTSTSIQCTTGQRLAFPDQNTFQVKIDGNVAIIEEQFTYVMPWSDQRTWGTDLPPVEGDLVVVPKGMALYVDQSTPLLEGIAVDGGKLIFKDGSDPIVVRAGFITLNGGEFIAGTEENPYQGNLQFIMTGSYYGRQQPIVGNKGIGCIRCKLSMHGKVRSHTWSTLASTVAAGASSFTLRDSVDWQVGEQIVIASTDFDHNHAERRRITAGSGTTFTVDRPFQFKHVSVTETYSGNSLKMEAQVGLLTRNIKMHGDDSSETIDGEYGSHLMIAGSSEEGAQGHIAYTEFFHCGQPRITGRYCTHFHMNGDVSNSYVKGIAVHDSFARILTIHAVKYLHVSYNVGYRVKGHNFFIEDGIETHNTLQYNLVISSLETFNMMQTDISVASYWITNPTNNLMFNRAAGGDFYGFWYEIKEHPDGPSGTTDICPIGNPLGESHDNVAHSYKRFGLRIFHLSSREEPCKPFRNDNLEDPWSENPSIQSRFYNYVLFKNGESGLLAQFTGNCVFQDFVVAQNKLSGMEFYTTNYTKEEVLVENATIIGQTAGNAQASEVTSTKGIILPRTSNIRLDGVNFHNFGSGTSVLKTCSKCDSKKFFTNVVKEYFVEGITMANVTGSSLQFTGYHKNDIIYNTDGSLTNAFNGIVKPSATLVFNHPHLQPETNCKPATNPSKWGSALLCDETITVRGVMFTNILPEYTFRGLPIKVQKISDWTEIVPEDSTSFTNRVSRLSQQSDKEPKKDKKAAYALPYITGRTYSVWFHTGVDFTHIAMDVSQLFVDADQAIIFKFNYTLNRELYEIGHLINTQSPQPEDFTVPSDHTVGLNTATCQFGDYTHFNGDDDSDDPRFLTLCATNRGKIVPRQYLDVNAIFCRYLCPAPTGQFDKENFVRSWSNATQWPNGVLPEDGDNITIPGPWTILMDMQPADMEFFHIDGRVIIPFTQTNIHIKAHSIWIRAGEFETEKDPDLGYWPGDLTFELLGNKNDRGYVFTPNLVGNKIIVNTGILKLYGKTPGTTWTRLQSIAHVGDTTINVGGSNGWQIGDQIVIGPTYSNADEHEIVEITGISGNTITFTPALAFNHYGAGSVTINNNVGKLDTRAAVGHITRKIRFISGEDSGWGYQLQNYGYSDTYFDEGVQQNVTVLRTGTVDLSGVQFYEGGQYDTEYAALRIQNAIGENTKKIVKSSFHDCKSYCMYMDNVVHAQLNNNVFYKGRLFHVRATQMTDYSFTNNLMIAATKRPTLSTKQLISCYSTWDAVQGRSISIKNNVCQGSHMHGFVLPHLTCDLVESGDALPYSQNTAGSTDTAFIFNKVGGDCLTVTGVRAYASNIAQISSPQGPKKVLYQDIIVADSGRAVTLRFGHNGNDQTAVFKNAFITAISRPTCSECYGSGAIDCSGNQAVRMLAVTVNGQALPSKFGSGFDVICKQEVFDAKAFLSDIVFENFNVEYADLPQCSDNFLFKPHSLASDMTGSHHLNNVVCNNCSVDSLARFTPPNPRDFGWFGGCGNLLCTGMNNYLIHDWTGDLLGFQGVLIANNSEIGDNQPGCTFNEKLNGHICQRDDFGVLEYQSKAPDFNTRIMWPVYLSPASGSWNTSTNGWRQWQWQGSEPLNRRLGRFVSIVKLNQQYNMTFQSEPPHDMVLQFQRRKLQTGEPDKYILVRLHYPRPNSIRVMNGGAVIKPISLLDNGGENDIDTSVCGSNKFFYFNNTVHFVVTGELGCMVRVSLTNSLQLTARFAMDIDDFFTNNGETLFIDRLCALLLIQDRSRVKVVGIYEGSVQLTAYIDESLTNLEEATQNDNDAHVQDLANLQEALGAILDDGTFEAEMTSAGLTGFEDMDVELHDHRSYTQEEEEEISPRSKIALIIGIAVAGVVFIGMLTIGSVYCLRRRAKIHQVSIGHRFQSAEKGVQTFSDQNSVIHLQKN